MQLVWFQRKKYHTPSSSGFSVWDLPPIAMGWKMGASKTIVSFMIGRFSSVFHFQCGRKSMAMIKQFCYQDFCCSEILAEEWGVSQKFLRNDSSISWEQCSIIFGDRSTIKFWDFNSMVTIGKKSPKHPKTVGMMVFIGDQHLSWVSQCFTHWYLLVTVVQDFLHQKISEVWCLFVASFQIVLDPPLTVSQPCVILLGARRFRITHEAPWRLFTWGGDSWLPGLLHFFAADFNHVWGDDFSWEKLLQRSTTNWCKDKNQPLWNPIQIWLKKKSIRVTLRWIRWQW